MLVLHYAHTPIEFGMLVQTKHENLLGILRAPNYSLQRLGRGQRRPAH